MDPVLVIGGCGALGHHIVKQLLESGEASDVTSFDLKNDVNCISGAKYVVGSVSSKQDVISVLHRVKPRVIIHTASPLLMAHSSTSKLFEEVNIAGTRNLLDSIHECGFTKVLVYTSSSSVIHNGQTDIVNATEDLPLCFFPEQTELYTHTKAVAEEMIRAENRKKGLLTIIIRGATLFGEGDVSTTPPLVENAKSWRRYLQVGNGHNLFDYTYIGNSAYAHLLAARALAETSLSAPPPPDDDRIDGEVFVITNDDPWPFWNFVHAVSASAGYPVGKQQVWVVPLQLYYVVVFLAEWIVYLLSFGRKQSRVNRKMVRFFSMTRTFDISKAKKRLGYRPQVTMQEGIERSVKAYLLSLNDKKSC